MVQRGGSGTQVQAQVGWLVGLCFNRCARLPARCCHVAPCPVAASRGIQLIWASLLPSPFPPQPTGQMEREFHKLVH